MKKKILGASIAITIIAVLLLYQGLYNLDGFLESYLRCLNEKATGELPSYYSCPHQFTDIQLIFMPIALFGISTWLGYWGFRNAVSEVLHFRVIIPVLVATASSVLTLTLKGIVMFFNYLDCLRQCPTGTCGGVTGTDPIYNCTFPLLEFALPLVIVGIASTIIAAYARERTKIVKPSPDS